MMNTNLIKIVVSLILCSSFTLTGCKNSTAAENDNEGGGTDIVETEEEKPKNEPIVLAENKYKPYAEVLDTIIEINGICDATTIYEDSGLIYADLLDINDDSNDELLFAYVNAPASNGIYSLEIWGIKNEEAVQLYNDEYNGTGLVNDRTVMITSNGSDNYICYATKYMSGREPDPYCIVESTDYIFNKIDGVNLIEVDHITRRDESSQLGDKRVVFKCNDEDISEEEFNSKFSTYTSTRNTEIINGNAGSPYWETTYDSIIENVNTVYKKINDELPEEVTALNYNEIIDLLNKGTESLFKVEESVMLHSYYEVHDTDYTSMMDGYVQPEQWGDELNNYFANGSGMTTYFSNKYMNEMENAINGEHPLNIGVLSKVTYKNVMKTTYDTSSDIILMKVLAKYSSGHSEYDDTYHDVSLKLEDGMLKIVDLYTYKSRYSDEALSQ